MTFFLVSQKFKKKKIIECFVYVFVVINVCEKYVKSLGSRIIRMAMINGSNNE